MNQMLNFKKRTNLAFLISLTMILVLLSACGAAAEPEPASPVGHWEFLSWMGAGNLPERLNDETGVIEVDVDRRDIVFLEDGTGRKISRVEDEEDYFFNWFIDEEDGLLIVEETIWDRIYDFNISYDEYFGYVLDLIEETGQFSLIRHFRMAE